MGDGWIHRESSNPSFKFAVQEREYVEYVLEKLSEHVCSVNEYKDGLFTLTTHSNPDFKKFESWYDSGSKNFPNSLQLTPTIFRHWYACDGSLVRNGPSSYANIGISNESESIDKIQSMISSAGLPEPRVNEWRETEAQLVWTVDDTEKILQYTEESVPGYEYKWRKS